VPMRPFLAGRIASVAPGAPIVQFASQTADTPIAARNLPEQVRLWTKPDPNPNVKDK